MKVTKDVIPAKAGMTLLKKVLKTGFPIKTFGNDGSFLMFLLLLFVVILPAPSSSQDTWANWERRLDHAFEHTFPRKLPGRALGILVPSDPRHDLLTMPAFGYEILANERIESIVFLLPAPSNSKVNGLVIPAIQEIETSFGRFVMDNDIRLLLENMSIPATVDYTLFLDGIPKILENQLAMLKYVLKGRTTQLKVLPILVRFEDLNSQVKDFAPLLAEKIRDAGLLNKTRIVIVGNLTQAVAEASLVQSDSQYLNAIRNLDIDGLLNLKQTALSQGAMFADMDSVAMGILTLRWLEADHGEVLAYAHSGQLVLTKDKNSPISFAVVGFSSEPSLPPKIPHIEQEKMLTIFGELLRSDLLAMTRQTCLSILDPTAAKPPPLPHAQASKKWPVYVSIYDDKGNLAGQAGSHVAVGPLEESVRQFAFEAIQTSKPRLKKETFPTHVVDVSIPYGFNKVVRPEEMVPYLNGVVVQVGRKTTAWHPDGWRVYPDPHQLLGAICAKLGVEPWSYANQMAKVESFRIMSFNEKEPFQDLTAGGKKKRKKKKQDDLINEPEDDTDSGGGGAFSF